MKKLIAIIFAISLIAPSPAQADAICNEECHYKKVKDEYDRAVLPIYQSFQNSLSKINLDLNNELQNTNKEFLAKESLAKLNYENALIKWKEIDQVMVDTSGPGKSCKEIMDSINREIMAGTRLGNLVQNPSLVCKFELPFYNSGKLINYTLDATDQNRSPSIAVEILGRVVSGPAPAGHYNGQVAGGPSNNIVYELVSFFPSNDASWANSYPEYHKNFNWDFEQEYAPSKKLWSGTRVLLNFEKQWMWSVKDDGSRVSSADFNKIRSNVKNAYAETISVKKQGEDAIKLINDKFTNLKQLTTEKYSLTSNTLLENFKSELNEIKWVTESNRQLVSNFPATAKKELMKQGYFKPLKTFYWTCETGRYIASAEWLDQYTVAVGGYWETKTCKDVPTKKEQSTWMKKSEAKLAEYTKTYNSIIELAKLKNLVVQCVAKNPCKISFKKD